MTTALTTLTHAVDPPTAAEAMHPNSAAAGEDLRHAPPPPTPDGGRPRFASGGGHSQLSFGNYQLPSSHPQQGNRPGLVPVTDRVGSGPASLPVAHAADPKQEEVSISVSDTIKPLLLKDLRIQLRARGLRYGV
eukprot:1149018-Pelagomonas_calceolata.AAC.1